MKRNFLGYGVFLGGGGEEEWGCVHATHGSTCSCVGLPLACCANNCNSCARYICTQHTPPLALPLCTTLINHSYTNAIISYALRDGYVRVCAVCVVCAVGGVMWFAIICRGEMGGELLCKYNPFRNYKVGEEYRMEKIKSFSLK